MKAKTILKWLSGIYFLLVALGFIIQGNFKGLVLIPFGLFIIPSTYQFLIEKRVNLKPTSKTKWIVALVGFLFLGIMISLNELSKDKSPNSIEQMFKKNKNIEENIEEITDAEILDFVHIAEMPTSEPRLTGEYMSKLDLNKFKIFTVKIYNKNGIEDNEKTQTRNILGYDSLKGYHGNKPNYNKTSIDQPDIIEDENSFDFMDSSGYCVKKTEFYNNIYDKKPECTYQIISSRKFIYENEKDNIPFQLVYPDRLLRLCK